MLSPWARQILPSQTCSDSPSWARDGAEGGELGEGQKGRSGQELEQSSAGRTQIQLRALCYFLSHFVFLGEQL